MKNIANYENWIFDWSGTLVDDLTMVIHATNHVLQVYGRSTMTREEFREQFRLPYMDFYQEVLPEVPLPELETHFRAGFAAAATSGVTSPILSHAYDFLEFLSAGGKRMFILSSMDAKAFDEHAQELGVDHFFEACYAGVLDKREQIDHILSEHQMDTKKTVFLGDMTHDVETAKHGGIASIALLTGYQNKQQLLPSKPDYLAKDLVEIRELFRD